MGPLSPRGCEAGALDASPPGGRTVRSAGSGVRAAEAELPRGRRETHGLGQKSANQKTNEKAKIGKGIDTHFLGKSN